jgi:cellulose synthase operon protein C
VTAAARSLGPAVAGAALAGALLVQPACAQQVPATEAAAATTAALTIDSAAALYRAGRYDDAVAALRDAAGPTGDAAARRLLIRVLLEVGRYDEAEDVALAGKGGADVPPELASAAGEVLWMRGRRAEAESLFARAVQAGAPDAPDALGARLNLARAQWERGARDTALQAFDWFIDAYNSGRARTADELTAVATAVRFLGVNDPALFHDARRAYEEAARLDPQHAESRLLEGELFLEKYNSTEAAALFREVLASNPGHPRALLGLARAHAFDGTDEALAFADSSLAVNPHAPAARAFRARLMLGLERYDSAAADAGRALAVDPASVDALGVLGAVHFLRGDRRGYEQLRARALALNPRSAAFDLAVAELAVQQRRYQDALDMAGRGIALEPTSWGAHALAGLTQLRLGDAAAARASLDVAFAGDPYSVWVKNTLDLLDTYPRYVTTRTDRFELFLHGDEAGLLSLYMAELAEEAYDVLVRRYGAEPELPVRVEAYPRHADFSVRTVGLTGLGALGVAFGRILAMDSPSAREPGSFNWGSTLWHEIAHAVTLAASDNRVPRWLTEGISVLEERRARPGWGLDATVDFVGALKQGLLLPVSELNAGFVRPTYPQQVMHAYYQASLVAEYIEAEHGAAALRRMLQAYRGGSTDEQVMRQVLRTEPAAFDARFHLYLHQRFVTQLAAIDVALNEQGGLTLTGGVFITALRAAARHMENGEPDRALQQVEHARVLFPEYVGQNSPYRLAHRIHLQRGDKRRATDALGQLVDRAHTDYAAHIELADLLEEQGRLADAAAVLERAMYIDPFEPQVHARMAALYSRTGQHHKAVRERRAVVALEPVNRADALYRLAAALLDAGDRDEARRQVLRALEIAPNFSDAQELLLRLRAGGRP